MQSLTNCLHFCDLGMPKDLNVCRLIICVHFAWPCGSCQFISSHNAHSIISCTIKQMSLVMSKSNTKVMIYEYIYHLLRSKKFHITYPESVNKHILSISGPISIVIKDAMNLKC